MSGAELELRGDVRNDGTAQMYRVPLLGLQNRCLVHFVVWEAPLPFFAPKAEAHLARWDWNLPDYHLRLQNLNQWETLRKPNSRSPIRIPRLLIFRNGLIAVVCWTE